MTLLTTLRNCITPAYKRQEFNSQFGYRSYQKACELFKLSPSDTLELKALAKEIPAPKKNVNLTRFTKRWVSEAAKEATNQLVHGERVLMKNLEKELNALHAAVPKSAEEYAEQQQRVLSALNAASEKVTPSTRVALERECRTVSLDSQIQRTLLALSKATTDSQRQRLNQRLGHLLEQAKSLNPR